jgi:UDP-N-acetylmuramate: L-alanyl-gamma-D-glutamyl-meso-diaminopimelate ligase
VRETLDALKAAYPGRRLIAVFEPRTNSSRRAIFQKDYVKAFAAADTVLLREPLPLANVPAEDHFSSRQLAADLLTNGQLQALSFPDTDTLLAQLEKDTARGDVVAILSNGGFDNIHVRLLEILKRKADDPAFGSNTK